MASTGMKFPMAFAASRSDDGRLIACVGRNVVVIDMVERATLSKSHPFKHPSNAAFSPDGTALAAKSTSGRIVILDPRSGEALFDHKNQKEGEGSNPLFSPNGDELVDGSWQGLLTVRSVREGVLQGRESFPGEMIGRVSHDRSRRTWLIEHSLKANGDLPPPPGYVSLRAWPFNSATSKVFRFDFNFQSATLSPDASRFCFIESSDARRIFVAKTSDGSIVASSASTEGGGTGSELAWSDDSRYLASVQSRKFVLYNASDLSVVGAVPCQYPSAIAFLPNNKLLLGSWSASAIMDLGHILAGQARLT